MGEGELISVGAFSPSSIEQSLIKGKDRGTGRQGDGVTGRKREDIVSLAPCLSLHRPVTPSPRRPVVFRYLGIIGSVIDDG